MIKPCQQFRQRREKLIVELVTMEAMEQLGQHFSLMDVKRKIYDMHPHIVITISEIDDLLEQYTAAGILKAYLPQTDNSVWRFNLKFQKVEFSDTPVKISTRYR